MWPVVPPTESAGDAFAACTVRIRDRDLRARLAFTKSDVISAAAMYETAAEHQTLHQLDADDFTAMSLTTKELSLVYESRMVPKAAPGRAIYERLMMAPRHGRCPLCGQRPVASLDHHLPKARFPLLSVAPLNLVPICTECNHVKHDFVPTSPEDHTLHPYFDDIHADRWLYAQVVEETPPALRFLVNPPASWDAVLASRVDGHFRRFGLAALYAGQAAQELSNIKHALGQVFSRAGEREVRAHLHEQAISRRMAQVNSWQTATYTALSENRWYCNGGFV
jgi:hypothetical protein